MLEPDMVVARRTDFAEDCLSVPPILSVEVLSPVTRRIDTVLKKNVLEEFGCPHYWVVDPDHPSITAWDLVDGVYQDGARAVGDESFGVSEPFKLSFSPAELIA